MKYYPEPLRKIQIPKCTVQAYLRQNCPGEDVAAMEFYGNQISWRTVFDTTQVVAKSLRAIGFGEGDQIPVFLSLVPEFLYILLAPSRSALPCFAVTIRCRKMWKRWPKPAPRS